MLLAGGEGTRLGVLTQNVAKPAVRFGGDYRIIDFSLSNCMNSGLDTIGVLTQYKPSTLNSHIGELTQWNLNRTDGGISILPPAEGPEGTSWYTGTANAVYQNASFVDQFNPEYVLIVSGDHVYNMDYRKMLEFHKQTNADATISVMPVKWEEASRFGIISADEHHRVTRFTEKPAKPDSNLASMGIYIFKWSVLKAFLNEDEQNAQSSHDFGKDVIPSMLEQGARLAAYPFKGYWRDVGTIESLWEAHMDLLEDKPLFQMNRKDWPLYTPSSSQGGLNSRAAAERKVSAEIVRSVVSAGVEIGTGSVVKECIIMPNVKIGRNVTIHKAIIAEGAVIEDGAIVGLPGYNEITVIAERQVVPGKLIKISKTLLPQGFQIRAGRTG
jgi:glucose-1-phosphate adenylyltransferase